MSKTKSTLVNPWDVVIPMLFLVALAGALSGIYFHQAGRRAERLDRQISECRQERKVPIYDAEGFISCLPKDNQIQVITSTSSGTWVSSGPVSGVITTK